MSHPEVPDMASEAGAENRPSPAEAHPEINRYRDAVNSMAAVLKAHPETRAARLFDLSERNESDLAQIGEARKFPQLDGDLRLELTDKLELEVMPHLEASLRDASGSPDAFTADQQGLLSEIYRRAIALRSALR